MGDDGNDNHLWGLKLGMGMCDDGMDGRTEWDGMVDMACILRGSCLVPCWLLKMGVDSALGFFVLLLLSSSLTAINI